MSLGKNISYLRKQKKITQEQLADQMNVTRQTVSRWESDEIVPELSKLVTMSELFSCNLDSLVKNDLPKQQGIYSDISVRRVAPFKYASFVIISPNPESDSQKLLHQWIEQTALSSTTNEVKVIGWDFPFVSQEQQNRFGMHGYVAACILPDGFETNVEGVQYGENQEADYAVITITEPFIQPFERIPKAYKLIMEYLQANNFKEKPQDNIIGCFEHEYTKDGITYMDVYIHVDGVTKVDAFSSFT